MEVYCGKCKAKTATKDARVVVYNISRTVKSGDVSTTPRNVIKGLCHCGTKKHILASKDIKIPATDIEEVKIEEIPKRKRKLKFSDDFSEKSCC
jgi:hypothetical protein